MVQDKARAVELWADMDWVMDGVKGGTVGMEYFMMLASLNDELTRLEDKTGLCLANASVAAASVVLPTVVNLKPAQSVVMYMDF